MQGAKAVLTCKNKTCQTEYRRSLESPDAELDLVAGIREGWCDDCWDVAMGMMMEAE